jgi:hypothetical protein
VQEIALLGVDRLDPDRVTRVPLNPHAAVLPESVAAPLPTVGSGIEVPGSVARGRRIFESRPGRPRTWRSA